MRSTNIILISLIGFTTATFDRINSMKLNSNSPSLASRNLGTKNLNCQNQQVLTTVNGISRCTSCGTNVESCSSAGNTRRTIIDTCFQSHFWTIANTCKQCDEGYGTGFNERVSNCTACPTYLSVTCVTGEENAKDLSCMTNSYLKDGVTCTECPYGFGTAHGNSDTLCTPCPSGSEFCNFNTSPTNSTSFLSTSKQILINLPLASLQ